MEADSGVAFSKRHLALKVEDGEEIVIQRHGKAVAQLVPVRRRRLSALGAMRGEFEMTEGWERALTDEEADAFYSGRQVASAR